MLRRSGSIKLVDLFGIRIGVDATWFFFLFLVIFWLSSYFRAALGSSDAVAYATTVVTVLLFFVSLIIHELGHALVARRQGIGVQRIDLFLFGGLTHMSRETATPGEELKVAIAGPAATAAFVVLCLALDMVIVGPHRLMHAIALDGTVSITPVLLSLSWLLAMNVVILAFNLVPAFPLDGGRIARALVWKRTGDKLAGTRAAAKLGQWFALALAGVGVWLLLSGGGLNGIWLVALAFLLGSSARAALIQSNAAAQLGAICVADVMDPDPVAIPDSTPASQALDEYFLRYGWPWFPVVDEHGRVVGVVRREALQALVDAGEGWLAVRSAIGSEEPRSLEVPADRPLLEAMGSDAFARLGAVLAVNADGVLLGVLTARRAQNALRSRLGQPAG
jgi:Zn-dependent protease